jgi:hypothetical protein
MKEVRQDQYFYACDGSILKNFTDLRNFSHRMSESTFRHHVTSDRNDFASWTEHVLCKPDIAKDLFECSSKDEMSSYLEKTLHSSKIPEREKRQGIIAMIKGAIVGHG